VSDIEEHLDDITQLARDCNTVVEFGVRGGESTRAILRGEPKRLISFDINDYDNKEEIHEARDRSSTDWEFRMQSSIEVEIPECDFLMIDSEHTYEQMKKELQLHKDKAKVIAFHDTVSFPAINKAIEEECGCWKVLKDKKNNNGFRVIERPE
jgi:hypothetical protein